MLVIDGGYGEAGGQIVRTATALSVLFKKPIKIINIRKGRNPPGLKAQHMTALKFLEKISGAKTKGIEIGSLEVEFKPFYIEGGKYNIDIGTAGSITLLLQAVILPLLFANRITELYIRGGTDVAWSPSADYFRFVILPYLRRFVYDLRFEVQRRGFYPKGGGIIYVRIKPRFKRDNYDSVEEFLEDLRKNIPRYNLIERKPLKEIYIYSFASDVLEKRKVAERQIEAAREMLEKEYDAKIAEIAIYDKTLSPGSVITIVGLRENNIVLGSDARGEKGKPAEEVGKEAAEKFIKEEKNGVVDNHLADNLIPYLGLVGGALQTSEFTGHLVTNIWTCEHFFGKIYEKDENLRIVRTTF